MSRPERKADFARSTRDRAALRTAPAELRMPLMNPCTRSRPAEDSTDPRFPRAERALPGRERSRATASATRDTTVFTTAARALLNTDTRAPVRPDTAARALPGRAEKKDTTLLTVAFTEAVAAVPAD